MSAAIALGLAAFNLICGAANVTMALRAWRSWRAAKLRMDELDAEIRQLQALDELAGQVRERLAQLHAIDIEALPPIRWPGATRH